jgi:hypothetical protein
MVKGWKIYQANGSPKQAAVAILTSDKVDFKLRLIKRNKEGQTFNAPNFIKHTLKDLKTYIDSNTVVVGDFHTPLSPIDRSPKQKIN